MNAPAYDTFDPSDYERPVSALIRRMDQDDIVRAFLCVERDPSLTAAFKAARTAVEPRPTLPMFKFAPAPAPTAPRPTFSIPRETIRRILAADRCSRGLHAWTSPSAFAVCLACGAQR